MFKIHREGRVALLFTAILIAAITYATIKFTQNEYFIYGAVALSVIAYLIVMFLFRITTRLSIDDKNAVLAPCDGKILAIDNVEEKLLIQASVKRIRVKTPLLNIHMKWFPISGKILQSFTQNENGKLCTNVLLETENKSKILIKTIPGSRLGKVKNYAREGKFADQNDHMGFAAFGSVTEIYIPAESELRIKSNQNIKGTQTVLARFKA